MCARAGPVLVLLQMNRERKRERERETGGVLSSGDKGGDVDVDKVY